MGSHHSVHVSLTQWVPAGDWDHAIQLPSLLVLSVRIIDVVLGVSNALLRQYNRSTLVFRLGYAIALALIRVYKTW